MRFGLGVLVVFALLAPAAHAQTLERRDLTITARDGTKLHASVAGVAPLEPRPVLLEASTYAPGAGLPYGPAYNHVALHVRGTGRSDGAWDVFGPTEQQDIRDAIAWICGQPWSDGSLALLGSSSSAISAYTAMRRRIPCLRTAVLHSGTTSLYRDVAYIGGVPHIALSAGFTGLVAAPWLQSQQSQDDPVAPVIGAAGYASAVAGFLSNQTETEFWTQRDFLTPIDPPSVPILAVSGFYDIEAPAAQQAYWATRRLGSKLMMVGGHERTAAALQHTKERSQAWLDHHMLGAPDKAKSVEAWWPEGGLTAYRENKVVKRTGASWPLPRTRFTSLWLRGERSGSATSINDGSLLSERPRSEEPADVFAPLPSNLAVSDPSFLAFTGAAAGPAGDGRSEEVKSLTYTTPPLERPVDVVGPGSLLLRAAVTGGEADLVAVVTDVAPDGTSTPVAVGRLRTSFPRIDRARSLRDPRTGLLFRPWNVFARKATPAPGRARRLRLQIWPLGNRFAAGHRLRLVVTGTALDDQAGQPALVTVSHDRRLRSRLVLPVVEGVQ